MIADTVLNNTKAYYKQTIVDCSIAINNGKILKIGKQTNMPNADTKINIQNQLVLPGLIDAHVHLRDEQKSYKEDFHSGTAAAAAGGFTTVLDMPNNEPVTMSAATLRNRMKTAENKILVNVGFRSEFPKNLEEVKHIAQEGALGFKFFMANQVGGLNINDDHAIQEAFQTINKHGLSTAVHPEDAQMLKKAEDNLKHHEKNDIAAFLRAHSEAVELKAVRRVLDIVRQSKTQIHFCHISTQDGLEAIVEGKKSGKPISCEATPHHLFLSADDLRRTGVSAITMPPLREKRHSEALWKGIRSGWIDIICSDHAPHALKEKEAESVWDVKVGIPGLETTLPLLLTEVNRARLSIGDVASLMAEKPAAIFRLNGKGYLKEGNDADLTVVDLHRRFGIDSSKFLSKAKYSPFDEREVEGKPMKTFIAGQLIMENGEILAKAGCGQIIRRE